MCGRFARIVSDKTLREKYRLERIAKLEDRYNISPMQSIAAVRAADQAAALARHKGILVALYPRLKQALFAAVEAQHEVMAAREGRVQGDR